MKENRINHLLIANGEVGAREVELIKGRKWARIIAADGGAANVLKLGLEPDTIIGDFDSVDTDFREKFNTGLWLHRPSQETGDLEKALAFCVAEGLRNLMVIGFTGKRLDHTLGNLSVLLRFDRTLNLELQTPYAQVFIVRSALEQKASPGQFVSLVPFGNADGVRTSGLKYPLSRESLCLGVREGTSNEVLGHRFRVSIESGILWVFLGDYE